MRRVFLILLVLLAGCFDPPNTPNFQPGEKVQIRVDGRPAMVVKVWYDSWAGHGQGWFINCRVGCPGQTPRDGLVSADTVITAYQIIKFRAYELKKLEQPNPSDEPDA